MPGQQNSSISPLPWYVHLLVGHSISGLAPWFLVCRLFYHQGRKRTAFAVSAVNLGLFAMLILLSVTSRLSWEILLAILVFGNFIWSMAAWGTQRLLFGAAPRRYRLQAWASWLIPLMVALIVGMGLSVIHALFPLIGERIRMFQSEDLSATKVLLWDLFRYAPFYVPYSLLVGLWWAGEERCFSARHIVSYLGGMLVFACCYTLLSWLMLFLLFRGNYIAAETGWSVLSRGLDGWRYTLFTLFSLDMVPFAVIPLLIGAAPRLRDFWKRALVVYPLVSLCLLSLGFFTPQLWEAIQEQLVYELSAADPQTRQQAYSRLDRMLDRFPGHEGRAELSLRLADFFHEQGETARAEAVYRRIIEESTPSKDFFSPAEIAGAALAEPQSTMAGAALELPPISHTSYMTQNWMALLQVAHFYRPDAASEAALLIKLKELSTEEERIKLSPMPTLAELDDTASNLGFACLILPSGIERIHTLIAAGYPVLQPIEDSFILLRGVDVDRGLAVGSLYRDVPLLLKENTGEDIDGDLMAETAGNSTEQQRRIEHLSRVLVPISFWGSSRQVDLAPHMAVVFPPADLGRIAQALGVSPEHLSRESRARLAALIALNALRSGDPIQAVEWAERSTQLTEQPLAYQVAHLADLFWKSRNSMPRKGFPIGEALPILKQVETEMGSPRFSSFLHQAEIQFAQDLAAKRLPWMVRREYRSLLDRSKPEDLRVMLELARQDVGNHPGNRIAWLELASLHEWQGNAREMLEALDGALAAGPWDDKLALDRTVALLRAGRFQEAKETLHAIEASQVQYDADYFFSRAMIAAWQGKERRARRAFGKALSMRRYSPWYHLEYAKFILGHDGDVTKAREALQWASRIDAQGDIRKQAQQLLQKLQANTVAVR